MPISVRFTRRKGYDTLQIRISVDGVEGSAFSTTDEKKTLIVAESQWDQSRQRRTDRSEAATKFNKTLDSIRVALNDVCDRQRAAGVEPTPKTVQREWQTGEKPEEVLPPAPPKPVDTLLSIYQAQIITLYSYKNTEQELDKTTIKKWEYGLNYLSQFLTSRGQINLLPEHVSIGWAKQYHAWLMQDGRMAADSATRYVMRISESITAWIEHMPPAEQRKAFNPLLGYKFGRGKPKDVYFLEKPHMEKFWRLDNRGDPGKCIWYMGAIFLTALDYPDLVRWLGDRQRYERMGKVRPYIEIAREKSGKLCRIPMWPELLSLLTLMPEGVPPSADEINDYMKGVEVMIGFDRRLTCKIGRKTGGYIFLLRGYTIRAVSRIMGHSSVAITESYYVKVTPELVDQETEELGNGPVRQIGYSHQGNIRKAG